MSRLNAKSWRLAMMTELECVTSGKIRQLQKSVFATTGEESSRMLIHG